MPEWIPRPQLPTELAAQIGRMKMQTSQVIPEAINKAIGNISNAFIQNAIASRAEKLKTEAMPTWKEAEEAGYEAPLEVPKVPGVPAGTVPKGYQGKVYQAPASRRMTQGEYDLLKMKAVPEMNLERQLAMQQLKGQQAEEMEGIKGHEILKKDMLGLKIGEKTLGDLGYKQGDSIPTSILTSIARPLSGYQQLTKEQIVETAKSMAEDGTSLDTLGGRGAQKALVNLEYKKLRDKNPSLLTTEQLAQQKKAGLQKSATLNSTQVTNEIVAVDQYTSAIDAAIKLAEYMPSGKFIPLNKWKIDAATKLYATKALNPEELATLNTVISEVGMQSSRVFSGTAATDTVFNNELKRLNVAYTKEMFVKSAKALRQIALARKNGLLGSPIYMPGGAKIQGQKNVVPTGTEAEKRNGAGAPSINTADPLGIL